jgi:hypothetical protein
MQNVYRSLFMHFFSRRGAEDAEEDHFFLLEFPARRKGRISGPRLPALTFHYHSHDASLPQLGKIIKPTAVFLETFS